MGLFLELGFRRAVKAGLKHAAEIAASWLKKRVVLLQRAVVTKRLEQKPLRRRNGCVQDILGELGVSPVTSCIFLCLQVQDVFSPREALITRCMESHYH